MTTRSTAQRPGVALAATHHDPEGRLFAQAERMLPLLATLFDAMVIGVSAQSQPHSIAALENAGVRVQIEHGTSLGQMGSARSRALASALEAGAEWLLFSDFDRVLHWAEFHGDELRDVLGALPAHDFTVLGRTERAFRSHPRVQTETERVINEVFERMIGQPWDITAAARGLSHRAAEALLAGCDEPTIGNDGTWPLFLRQAGGFSLGYRATEGLEFETADRFPAEVAAAGGVAAWIAQLDNDPQAWAARLELARIEVQAFVPYAR